MLNPYRIGIVGHGFVGQAVQNAFLDQDKFSITVYDPAFPSICEVQRLYDSFYEYKEDCLDVIFVCVPTPQLDNGAIDSSIVQNTVNNLLQNTNAVIVIKSTVVPSDVPIHKRVIYNPEFLTEQNAKEDFLNAPQHIVGGETKAIEKLIEVYRNSKIKNKIFHQMSVKEASFIKYAINTFLATKVTFFNQLYDLVQEHDCNWDTIVNAVTADKRIAKGHTKVADKGRKRGFGGACFPKDINAFLQFSKGDFSLLKEVIYINDFYRQEYELTNREKTNNINYSK